jgi:hypothetical protein
VSVSVPLRLRPLEIGDILDETFRMYRRHFPLFAGLSVILAIPAAAVYGLAIAWVSVGLQQTANRSDTALLGGFWIGLLGAFVVGVLILPFTHSAVTYAACESALGRPVTPGGIFSGVLRRYFPLLGYWLAFNSVTAALAIVLCIAPFVLWLWLFVMWIAVTPIMFVENVGLGWAGSRSRLLVQGRWWRTFLIIFLTVVIYELVALAIGAFLQIAQLILEQFLSQFIVTAIALVASQLFAALLTPILQIVIVLVYFDLRVRKEALDLFQHAYQLAAPPATI